ncbi:hypothetical protein Tco_0657747 [Tanacetum coccineum]
MHTLSVCMHRKVKQPNMKEEPDLTIESETWKKAEDALEEGDGAFYGPKIDIYGSDAFKYMFQLATLLVRDAIHKAGYYANVLLVERCLVIVWVRNGSERKFVP